MKKTKKLKKLMGGIDMKTNMMELKKQAKQLVIISKQKNIIKPHTEAFKDFPVNEESFDIKESE